MAALLGAKADVNQRGRDAETALFYVSRSGDQRGGAALDIFKLLLDAGAEVDDRNDSGETVLMKVVSADNLALTQALLGWRADVNAASKIGKTPLFFAVEDDENNPDVARFLLKHGADPNRALTGGSFDGETPLTRAAAHGKYGVVSRCWRPERVSITLGMTGPPP